MTTSTRARPGASDAANLALDGQTLADLRDALAHTKPPDDYHDFARIAAGAHASGRGLPLDEIESLWAAKGPKYKAGELVKKSGHLHEKIGPPTVFWWARNQGWRPPMRRSAGYPRPRRTDPPAAKLVTLPCLMTDTWRVGDLMESYVWYIHDPSGGKAQSGFTLRDGTAMRHSVDNCNAKLTREGGQYLSKSLERTLTLLGHRPYAYIRRFTDRGTLNGQTLPPRCYPSLSFIGGSENPFPAPMLAFDFDYRADQDVEGLGAAARAKCADLCRAWSMPIAVSRGGQGFHALGLLDEITGYAGAWGVSKIMLAPGLTLDIMLPGGARSLGLQADRLDPAAALPVIPAARVKELLGAKGGVDFVAVISGEARASAFVERHCRVCGAEGLSGGREVCAVCEVWLALVEEDAPVGDDGLSACADCGEGFYPVGDGSRRCGMCQ